MGIYRAWLSKRLPKWLIFTLLPIVVALILIDVVANLIIGTIFFFDFPREWLLTDRLKRYADYDGLRGRISRWICNHALDLFDPKNDHC